jgi:integrase
MVRYLKIDEWPDRDQTAWAGACHPHLRLRRGGRAAHLKDATHKDLASRFGAFLGFLERTHRLQRDRSALTFIAPDVIMEYVAELQARVSSVTVHGSIYKLRRMAEILDPDLDLLWLREIEIELEDRMRPAPKGHRVVSADKIFKAGVALIGKAETQTDRTDLQRARMARDGLLIAFLAICPIRLKNLASLTIGGTIVSDGDEWWMLLPDTDTKSNRLDHRVIPQVLAQWIDVYIGRHKPVFPTSETAMWPSQYGGAMSASGVQRLVTETTRRELGKAVNPHMFRHCVPYTIASIDGSQIDLASSLLQHNDPRTTQKHYNLAHSVESSKAFGEIVSGLLKDDLKVGDVRKPRP